MKELKIEDTFYYSNKMYENLYSIRDMHIELLKLDNNGEITNIIQRAKSEYVGVIQIHKSYAFVIPDGNKMYTDIFVPINKINKAEEGDRVLVSLEDWPEKADSPYGRVLKVLGKPDGLFRYRIVFRPPHYT